MGLGFATVAKYVELMSLTLERRRPGQDIGLAEENMCKRCKKETQVG